MTRKKATKGALMKRHRYDVSLKEKKNEPECVPSELKASLFVYFQELDKDSDVDTGFYSDDEEAPSSKRRSLLVALKYVCVCVCVCWGGFSIDEITFKAEI